MAGAFRFGRMWLFGLLAGLYRALVLQNLWNWFAVGPIGLQPISYWGMYGLIMLIGLVFTAARNEFVEEATWDRAFLFLAGCLPPERKEEVDDELARQNEEVWFRAGGKVLSDASGNTVALGIGWFIHAFLL